MVEAHTFTTENLPPTNLEQPEIVFTRLFEQHSKAVTRYLRYRRGLSEEAAEDLTQEAFVKAWVSLPTFEGDQFKTWLYRIAVNVATDSYRHEALREPRERQATERLNTPGVSDTALEAIGNLEDAETSHLVNSAMMQLHPRQHLVLTLRFHDELSYEEIATQIEASVSTVKSLLHRAKTQLRKKLEDGGYDRENNLF